MLLDQFGEVPEERLTGTDFQKKVEERLAWYKERGIAHISKYGVQVMGSPDPSHPSGTRWTPLRSFPDFEGVMPNGRQTIFDAKVASGSSFPLTEYRWDGTKAGSKARQLRHMLDRSAYRVPCYFLIHWNARAGKTFEHGSETWLFPIGFDVDFWNRFLRAEVKSISRSDCEEHGTRVKWTRKGSERSSRPDVVHAIDQDMFDRCLE